MRARFGFLMLVAAAAIGSGTGCSCGGHAAGQDAGTDAEPPAKFDAGRDVAASDDAGPTCGTFQALDGCGFELTRCTAAKDNSDECLGLDCVDSSLYGLICLRKCNCSAECGFNTICLPSKTTDYSSLTNAQALTGNAKGHCFFSLCGGGGSYEAAVGNGTLYGACNLGGDAFIKAGKVDTRPGTCMPLWTNEPNGTALGVCEQSGSKPRGGACTFDTDQCHAESTFDACAVGSVCIGRQGQTTGTCAKLCNPNTNGFNPAVTGDCAADSDVTYDQYCQDSSSYQRDCTAYDGGVTYSNSIFYNYVGFCVDGPACDVLATTNTCASVVSDGGVAQNGCEPTTAVDSFGLCGPTGSAGLHANCGTTTLCQAGLVCITWQGQTQGTCEKYCGLGPNDGKWPCDTNEVCDSILYGTDPSSECWDDPWTLGFGVCKPDTRQDAGTPQDGATDA